MTSKIDAKIGIESSRFRGCLVAKEIPRLAARRGEVNFPPGCRRFGRKKKEERTKERKEERNI